MNSMDSFLDEERSCCRQISTDEINFNQTVKGLEFQLDVFNGNLLETNGDFEH